MTPNGIRPVRAEWIQTMNSRRPPGTPEIAANHDGLMRLQKASEGVEASFVKQLLETMKKSSWAEKKGPMGDLADDLMNQRLSESISQSPQTFGLARQVFLGSASQVLGLTTPAGATDDPARSTTEG